MLSVSSVITEWASSNSIAPWQRGVGVSLQHHTQVRERVVRKRNKTPSIHYNSVGKGVGDSCSLGAYLAKKGKKTVSMTPTMASM